MIKIKEITWSAFNSDLKFFAHTEDNQKFILERKEALQLIQDTLNLGYTTTLKPNQKYFRIEPISAICSQIECNKPAFKPYCWCIEHHNQRANS